MTKHRFVKSHYASPWKGVVVDCQKRKNMGDLLFILVLLDKSGRIPSKRITKVLDAGWTTPCEEINLTQYNPDWFVDIEFSGGYLPYQPLNHLKF